MIVPSEEEVVSFEDILLNFETCDNKFYPK
jgi:hypothetical protein